MESKTNQLMRIDRHDSDPPLRTRVDVESLVGGHPCDVYRDIARHQRTECWYGKDIVAVLQAWAERFIGEFKLEVAEVSLCIEELPFSRYAHFRQGHNGFGLKGEIAFNTRYLQGQREQWQVLGTLLHELLHGWQQAHGTPGKGNYHNREFRRKAAGLGLIIDKRGATGYTADSLFKEILRRHHVEVPRVEIPAVTRRHRGNSKMKKWTCGCTNVRCAVELHAQCLQCVQLFRLCE